MINPLTEQLISAGYKKHKDYFKDTMFYQKALHKIDVIENEIDELKAQIRKDALQSLSDLDQMAVNAFKTGLLERMLLAIVDWAYHQEDKPEWLDGAEGVLRKVKDD